jgi:pilus retraction protein PilT
MYLDPYFKLMAEKQASDLFITCGAPLNIKINGVVAPITTQRMDVETVRRIAYELMNKEQAREFENELEMNLSHLDGAYGNYRINIFRQRGTISLVVRYVRSNIPSFSALKLPAVLLDIVTAKRGMVLIAGATGSGKSTTLAAMIDHRNSNQSGHILTVEDPIEYLFQHKKSVVNQREIGVDTVSYHAALANALREAPDLIMVGEIRDKETADMAVQAALTGHLVFSTLHTNDAAASIARLLELGIPNYLVNATLIGILAQRLVRTLCPHCKAPGEPIEPTLWKELVAPWRSNVPDKIYHPIGCLECRRTGYMGRTGLIEMLVMTDAMRKLIAEKGDLVQLRGQAARDGLRSLRVSGAEKIAKGITTMEEVLKAAPPFNN